MQRRRSSIIYQLATSETPLTAQQIAKRLGVCSRTVKAEMQEIRKELEKEGASLIAKRNEGYSIRISDQKRFLQFSQQLNQDTSLINNPIMDYMSSFLYISRKLLSSSKYIKIDDIADELYTSRSTLRDPIKATMEFLGSYRLITESAPGLGIRAYGLEHHARMAMTELFADYFDKVPINYNGVEYSKLVSCDETERQGIFHRFFAILILSGIRIPDSYAKNLSLYLIIARNRHELGYRVILPNVWINEIKQYKEYQVAQDIYDNLAKEFSGFDMPMQEVAFLAIWLLSNRDMSDVRATPEEFPSLFDDATRYAKDLIDCVEVEHHIRLDRFDWVTEELRDMLIPILAKVHFELSGAKTIESMYKKQIGESPVTLEIARTMMRVLEKHLGSKAVEYSHIRMFSNMVYKVLLCTSYDKKKLKLLIVNSEGLNFGTCTIQKLMNHFEPLIESCTCCEFYEIQEMAPEEFDAVIQNNQEYHHESDLLQGTVHTITHESELVKIYNNILIHAYQFQHLLPDDSMIHVYQDFDYVSKEQFLQLISYKHCNINENQKQLEYLFLRNDQIASYQSNKQLVFLFGRTELVEDETIEIYFLKNPGNWSGNEIRYILYVCFDWKDDIHLLKALNDCLCQLSINPELFQLFISEKSSAFEKIIRQSLKM